ncbi:MAG: ShlB/FhaC/HecB family hemolysin secretion/activation protein [Cyanobacteria bacterium HKST-UBA04]|nr:ShlB/FhaC/HecB family hemolysin secretion/activation protein [Cyanobacteria bacterium HKST-UBA04]
MALYGIGQSNCPSEAQVPTPQPRDTAGAVQKKDIENQRERKNRLHPQQEPETEVEDEQEDTTPQSTQPQTTVTLSSITIEDATLLDPEALDRVKADYLNRPLTFDDIEKLTDALSDLYHQAGYVTSRVYIPPQTIKGGQLTLKAAEGKVGIITVESGRWFKKRSVLPYVTLDRGEHFNLNKLKRDLRRINQNPDRNVRAILKAGEETGQTDINLKVTDQFPIHLSTNWDNMGRDLIGTNRLGTTATFNNLLGFGDTGWATANFTRRSFGHGEHYEIPVSSHGTSIGSNYYFSNLLLGTIQGLENFRITGQAQTISGYVKQEWVNTEKYKIAQDVSLNFVDLETSINNAITRQQVGGGRFNDSVRVLRTGVNIERYGQSSRTFVRPEASLGLDILGGDVARKPGGIGSRLGAGSQFLKLSGSAMHTQQLPFLNALGIFRVSGQYTPDSLVSAEQFQAGGAFTVRGYKEGTLIADKGMVSSVEIRVPLRVFPKDWKLPLAEQSLNDALEAVGFIDHGYTMVANPTPGTNQNQSILGTGCGLRYRLTKYLVGWLDLGFPLLLNASNKQTARLHFGVQSELF